MRDPVGPGVQLPVAQPDGAEGERDGLRGEPGLAFEELVGSGVERTQRFRTSAGREQRPAPAGREDLQGAERRVGRRPRPWASRWTKDSASRRAVPGSNRSVR
ncbi:hypothetical protein GCM10018952_21890 [Streptosporangium vulgare]